MKYSIKKRDLFSVSTEYNLCHCISSDFALGAGIAKKFSELGVRAALNKFYGSMLINRWNGEGYCLFTPASKWGEFNLVTKEKYWHKPTLETMEQALISMKNLTADAIDTPKIAMPRIGCGLDRLKWSDVEQVIKKVFENTDTEILVCDWN